MTTRTVGGYAMYAETMDREIRITPQQEAHRRSMTLRMWASLRSGTHGA